jgi:hypothetical protein
MRHKERWLFVSALGLLIFNWPFLDIFGKEIPFYLFVLWSLFIILLALIGRREDTENTDE